MVVDALRRIHRNVGAALCRQLLGDGAALRMLPGSYPSNVWRRTVELYFHILAAGDQNFTAQVSTYGCGSTNNDSGAIQLRGIRVKVS